MKGLLLLLTITTLWFAPLARASEADDTSIAVTNQTAGATPFISKLSLLITGAPATIKSIQYTIAPKPGSVTRPLSATYLVDYLKEHGAFHEDTGDVTLTVWGLYAGADNSVTLKYAFDDGSSKQDIIRVTTGLYDEPGTCDFTHPTVVQARTRSTELSYDFILVTSQCNNNSPTILDTDGAVRWVGTANIGGSYTAVFYDNAIYLGNFPQLLRIEMDGSVRLLADYTRLGVRALTHNIDIGRDGLILDVHTDDYVGSVNIEVDPQTGDVLRTWSMGDIISAAMAAGGDDPTQFVQRSNGDYNFGSPADWWHNNSTAFRRSDNTILVSSRENFVIALDYDSNAIKWILGDPAKQWHQFPSLRQFALTLAPGTVPNVGQHAISITKDDNLLLMDNGAESAHHTPAGIHIDYSAPRKYSLNLANRVATEVWNYPNDRSVWSPFCSSVYEDAPSNYIVDYAVIGGINANTTAQILGLTPRGEKVFDYQYPTGACNDAFRSLPIHLEDTSFPTSAVRLANISARAEVGTGDKIAIAGFIVPDGPPKPVVIRGIGPSLQVNNQFVAGRLMDPMLELYDSNGHLIASNDNYQTAPEAGKAMITRAGLLPTDNHESAIAQVLPAGAYTAVLRGAAGSSGIGLVEVYDTDADGASKLANLSSRAFVEGGNGVLIGGVILKGNVTKRVLFRAIGPELEAAGLANALRDTTLTVIDQNGTSIGSNDNWRDAGNATEIATTGIAPQRDAEAAVLMPMIAGSYTAIVQGKNGATGFAVLDVYQLD